MEDEARYYNLHIIVIIVIKMKALINKFLNKNVTKESPRKPIVECTSNGRVPDQKKGSSRRANDGSDSYSDDDEVVNMLIKMSDIIRITKKSRELHGEHITLRHINHLLSQQFIDTQQLRRFLMCKTTEIEQRQKFAQEENREGGSAKNAVNHELFTYYSNGLIFQFYSVRALLWKISLEYLQPSKNKWVSLMEGKLLAYHDYIKEHILELVSKQRNKKELNLAETNKCGEGEEKKPVVDHPLNLLKQSKWKTLFEDRNLWNLIEKDTIRTKPRCIFFQEQFEIQMEDIDLQKYGTMRNEVHLSKDKEKRKTYYYDCLTRIIYIFLKRHPQFQYCQGMNELAALIFYSFANKNSEYFRRVAESDAYFCFETVLRELHKYSIGFLVGEKYSKWFQQLLKKVDLRLYQELEAIEGTLESLRILSIKWFSSLFLNEFEIDESLILWDGFIATLNNQKENGDSISFQNLMMAIGLALIHMNRKSLSQGENPLIIFSKITHSPESLLEKGLNLYTIFRKFFQ